LTPQVGTLTVAVQPGGTLAADVPVLIGQSGPFLSIADASTPEGIKGTHGLSFVVTLTAPAAKKLTLHWATSDGTAHAGSDYVAKSGTLRIKKGASGGTITVKVKGDRTVEPDETFHVTLSSPSAGTLLRPAATGTIVNDD